MVDEKWGMARRAAFRRRTMPDAPRASCALELADCWCRSSAFQVLSMACERARDRAPAGCPISARRRAVLRLLRPPAFPGRRRSAQVVISKFRAVCVAPGASLALRLKAPPSERPGAYACGRRANHSIVGLQRPRPRGAANRREREDGCPFNSILRRTIVQARAPLHQRTESTGSPVGLQACYKALGASLPANSMQFEGKSENVWLMWGYGGHCDGAEGDAEASAT
jgi:hypothetical protein